MICRNRGRLPRSGLVHDKQLLSLPKIAETLLVGMERYFDSQIELVEALAGH